MINAEKGLIMSENEVSMINTGKGLIMSAESPFDRCGYIIGSSVRGQNSDNFQVGF